MEKKYIVRLNDEERTELQIIVKKQTPSSRKVTAEGFLLCFLKSIFNGNSSFRQMASPNSSGPSSPRTPPSTAST